MSQRGRRSGRDVPQRHAKCHSCFSGQYLLVIYTVAGPLNWSDSGRNSRPCVLQSVSPLACRCVFQGLQWPAVPYGPLLWARESRNTKLILRTEGLNRPSLHHTKACKKCVAFLQFPRHEQMSLLYMHMNTLNIVYVANVYNQIYRWYLRQNVFIKSTGHTLGT